MVGAGDLDRRVTLQRLDQTPDSFGAPIETWTDIATVWARREDLLDRERFAAAETGAARLTRWIVRQSAATRAVRASDRLVDGNGDIYQINGIRETAEGRGRFLELSTAVRIDQP
jgi:SPP1 family predicted phage head-tail adaptor